MYYVGFVAEGKRRWKSTNCTTKTDALQSVSRLADLFKLKQQVVTLQQFTTDFLEFAKGNYSKCTVDFYRVALNHLQAIAGDCVLSTLTMQHIDMYKVKRLADQVSAVTVNRELQALRAAMNTATNWKVMPANPFGKMQQLRVPEVAPAFFTREDFEKLIALIRENWLKELVIFAALTGLRRGEAVHLRWPDVDMQRRVILIQSNPTFKTKHGKRRVVPMNDGVFNLLQAKAGKSTNEYVFTKNGKRILDDHAGKKLKKYVVDFGLPEGLHFHSLRHTFASWLAQDGVSLYTIQKLLGHSSSSVTQIYSHLLPEQLHSTVNRLTFSLN